MHKNMTVIVGHPDPESYCHALAQAYIRGAKAAGADVKLLDLAAMRFDPILQYGYRKRTELEPDLIQAREAILQADHLVWVYPTWWGTMPALLKGFIDRVFLPGFAFASAPDSLAVNKLLKGKTARLLVTMDSPSWYYRLALRRAGHVIMKRGILQFSGIRPVRITEINKVKMLSAEKRKHWLEKAEALGAKLA
ncbi:MULTISPECIES: NAD(P)H-dependent oxidoreductase [Paenibacillus]|uniref:NAD(P)H dehydrogenase (Quinone) n=1 Tax=Paenibacillus albilobatus TaxID=2716884 RepID=A0A919XGY0_9BACL|nr:MULTISPECIES: NAD(P)H-dependent oxidoreductase [Paenibacillus]GIO32627.1 NAD(P)H dehydrogenase (quinone) [Paenibacillus albilobatus]